MKSSMNQAASHLARRGELGGVEQNRRFSEGGASKELLAKEKKSSFPSERRAGVLSCRSPLLLLEGPHDRLALW